MLDQKERKMSPKSFSIPENESKDEKGSNDKNDKNVEKLIKTYENKTIKSNLTGEENTLKSPSLKLIKESRVDLMKKIRSPVISNAASPVRKKEKRRKLESNIKSVIEKLSTQRNKSPSVRGKNSVSKFQRTILDIWGPEVSDVSAKDDR